MRKKWIYIAPLAIVGMVIFVAIGGTVVRELWNWLAPSLFGLKTITFWQALGLLALCRILFGGFGLHGSHRADRRRMFERWEAMSPEERERFREGLRGRCGYPAASDVPIPPRRDGGE
ncbi:MAG: hypothetical protein WC538_00635 [Thermoanaerobaculia bacterium]|jgi:hypothetical protein